MTTGTGGKPPSGSQPGTRPAADTPNRLVVRSLDSGSGGDSMLGATDTAVAVDGSKRFAPTAAGPTPHAGIQAITAELVGSTLSGKFLVNKKVGQGGMGAVYEATHTQLGRRFAVKVLLEKYAQREAIVRRLKQEAQLASSIGHEHIIDITDIGTTDDGRTYVVMEYLEGESLAECLARETKLPEQRILRIISQAASALAAAHAKGIVHRDIKPENLFLLKRKEQDFVKVVDFGISKSLRASGEEEEQVRLTQTGMVLGTPLYMSPEQARGDDALDARVDIYALGVIMYEAATGRVPFIGNNYLSVISQVLNEQPKSVRELRPELSEEFEAIVQRAMAKKKEERYASANDMLADLNALLEDPTHSTERAKITGPRRKLPPKSSARYVVWIGGVAVIVAAVAFTVKIMMSDSKPVAAPIDAAKLAPPVDAAPQVVTVDAPPPVPEAELIEVEIITVPPGATIIKDGVELEKTTPLKVKVVKSNKEVSLVAKLAGHDDHEFKFNPLELPAKKPQQKVNLKKVKPGVRPIQITPKQGSAAGSGAGSGATANPDGLSGSPYGPTGGGTVPKKP
jgi:serine/threonine-protein kinase